MDTIEKYRDLWIPEQYLTKNAFTGKQREYSLKYGYHFCYEYFSPHFTVAGNDMTEERFQQIKAKLLAQCEDIRISIKELAFFDRDNNNKLFVKIPLGGN